MRTSIRAAVALSALLSIGLTPGPHAAQKSGSQVATTLKKKITKTVSVDYLLYLPKEYGKDKAAKWPLILFLHGAGERGSDVTKVKANGPPMLVDKGKELPFIIVSPQCPENSWWSSETLLPLLDEIQKKYAVDPDRVYLTGLSMGGFGTWTLATEHPERFAAIAPICGGGEPRRARRLKEIPTWVFHGGKDPVVPIAQSQEMVDALKTAGGDVKFTIYPEAGHDSWVQAYNDPALFEWFLSHRRHR